MDAAEPESPYRQRSLFEEPNLFSQQEEKKEAPKERKITVGSKVTIRRSDGQEFHYHIIPNAEKGYFSGEYKQILTVSRLGMAMMGKRVGDKFEYVEVWYEVVGME